MYTRCKQRKPRISPLLSHCLESREPDVYTGAALILVAVWIPRQGGFVFGFPLCDVFVTCLPQINGLCVLVCTTGLQLGMRKLYIFDR